MQEEESFVKDDNPADPTWHASKHLLLHKGLFWVGSAISYIACPTAPGLLLPV